MYNSTKYRYIRKNISEIGNIFAKALDKEIIKVYNSLTTNDT